MPPSATIEEPVSGYPVLVVKHPLAAARVALHGGHVMEWAPAGHAPVLYLSPAAVFAAGKAIRGGIPVCWPWFGAYPEDPSLPAHGLARNRFWSLVAVEEDVEGVRVRLELADDESTRSIWPHAFHLAITLRIGREFLVSLTTTNTGDGPFAYGGALHTYLALGDTDACRIDGLDGCIYKDMVGPAAERVQSGPVRIDREVDRVYRGAGEVVLHDDRLGRSLAITREGAKDVVVWNPWQDKSAGMKDLPGEGYRKFVCIEAAVTDEPMPVLPPGAAHTLSTRIRVL